MKSRDNLARSPMTLSTQREVDDPRMRGRLEDHLRRAAGANLTLENVTLLGGGTIQENWGLDVAVRDGTMAGKRQWVLRTGAPASIAVSLTRAQEFAVLRVAREAGVAVPRPLWLCRDPDVIGREFFVMERVAGIAAGHRVTREIEQAADRTALAEALGENLGLLHAVRPPREELDFLPLPRGSAAVESISTYRGHLERIAVWRPVLEWGLRWCELNAPPTGQLRLIHRDYRTGNYLVHEGKLAAVLDWEFAGWGDPREDIGWFMAKCWRFAGAAREAGGIAGAADFLRGYERNSDQRYDLDEIKYWQVMAHLRWAVIALQQAERHLSGAQPSLELALTGHLVPELEMEILAMTAGSSR